jgi:FkbM family methyltransferase
MKIFYGLEDNKIDVTGYCFDNLLNNNIIFIPCDDHKRAFYFTDIANGAEKSVFIEIDNITKNYGPLFSIKINTINNEVIVVNEYEITKNINNKINEIHSNLKINYGSLQDELPEQKMVVRYLTGNEKVLEIGGNIGRNSLIIGSILNGNKNFVTLESDPDSAKKLCENRDSNNMNFYVESSALSKRNLIQKGWDTIESDVTLDGYFSVNIISFDDLISKYNIDFNTLVVDCEGALYYILLDMPEILNNINLVIMENDYTDINKKKLVDNVLINNNFKVDYFECGPRGVGFACEDNFYEVWVKNVVIEPVAEPVNKPKSK